MGCFAFGRFGMPLHEKRGCVGNTSRCWRRGAAQGRTDGVCRRRSEQNSTYSSDRVDVVLCVCSFLFFFFTLLNTTTQQQQDWLCLDFHPAVKNLISLIPAMTPFLLSHPDLPSPPEQKIATSLTVYTSVLIHGRPQPFKINPHIPATRCGRAKRIGHCVGILR
jgi:hypothetical protein